MTHQIKSYFRFLWSSKNRHGVHSPFVYNLVTQCFNDKKRYPEYQVFDLYRKRLLKNSEVLTISDFGEGSRVFKENQRKVSRIARVSAVTKKRQRLLFRLSRYLEAENILELGTSLGMGTLAFSLSGKEKTIETVEGSPSVFKKAKEGLDTFSCGNIEMHQMVFSDFLNINDKNYDIILVDGDHNGERTYRYFQSLLSHVHNDSLVIFDDIYWSKDMTATWNKIIAHEQSIVTIDTFQWGMVFFRKEQRKQHFILRI